REYILKYSVKITRAINIKVVLIIVLFAMHANAHVRFVGHLIKIQLAFN
ncbi:MAG: hypothetical protein ACJARP_002760, partial [Vicingaceae bacterium]